MKNEDLDNLRVKELWEIITRKATCQMTNGEAQIKFDQRGKKACMIILFDI